MLASTAKMGRRRDIPLAATLMTVLMEAVGATGEASSLAMERLVVRPLMLLEVDGDWNANAELESRAVARIEVFMINVCTTIWRRGRDQSYERDVIG